MTATTPAAFDAASLVDIHGLARRHAGDRTDITWLDTAASLGLLDMAGLPVVSRAHARSVDVCADAAYGTGYLCGVEADIADLVHASDSGAVRPGARDALAGVNTSRQFRRQFGDHLRGVLVQAEEMPTIELRVGAIRDPAFGPLVLVGAGGVEAELRDDRVVLVAPVATSAARRAIESLRLAPLFHGFHGPPELPVDRVVELIQRTAMLAAAVPEIQQLDINPVLVGPQACVVVDASIGVAASR